MEIANFGVEEWLNKWEKKAIYDIAQSSIEALTLEELIGLDGTTVNEFFTQRSHLPLDYGWIEGSEAFKEQVAALYHTVKPQNVLQTNGATGANLLALYALIEPGDHVISMLPTYQQLYDIPRSIGASIDFVELKEEENWRFDVEKLAGLVKPETKMICLNSANNPTGTLLDRQTLEQIVAIAKRVGAYVLVDEVYAPLAAEGEFVSIADLYDKGIATNSLSKTYSIPGIRIGWTATNAELAELFRKYRDYTMICGGVLSDDLAVHALKNKEKILARNKKIVAENLAILKDWVASEPKVSLVMPNYVSTSFIKLDIKDDDTQFCIDLLEETGVLLVPGSAFDLPKHARLGYCCKKEVLEKGLTLLSEFLAKS
ncbi:aminotransferase [Enterococcus villorum]|uniref:Aminotransferase n=2 Tax=Enterococcus villorum TaxID=112904 RepID=A0A511J1Z8_9ENTE|nr:aminotransferase [Enterococcus villorum]EOH92522.1 aspartate aminotransferase [Enterococcus villorum ATCC 700913]EOW75625.1 aspartate aminotransferase [Enterococcus villorum ATCC 700913]GEL92045.1 aminotransferase [Enterococcus villorum]